jgi:GNAT superfamily N-acetyltransferase
MAAQLHLLDPGNVLDSEACFEVFQVLRPHLDREEFLRRLQIQHGEGFRIVFLRHDGRVAAAAGYRVMHYLAWGRVLYLDDLVTLPAMKRAGLGGQLMDWLAGEAKRLECDELHLDTGYQRHDAHRLYLRKGLQLTCHHLSMALPA